MLLKNKRLEVMQFLEKDISSIIEKYLIPIEKIWQPTDFLPNSQGDNFIEEVKEIVAGMQSAQCCIDCARMSTT